MDALAVSYSTELALWGIETTIMVPGAFTQTAGKTISGMYEHMMRRKAGAANPENWPDYEI